MRRYEYDLLDACLLVHGYVTGNTLVDPVEARKIIEWLRMRIREWTPDRCQVDTAVRGLVLAVLDEVPS